MESQCLPVFFHSKIVPNQIVPSNKSEGDMPIKYEQTTDKEIHAQVRRKHQSAIHDLKRAGFEEYCFFSETVQALGFSPLGLTGFFGALIALFKEVAKVEGNLNVSVFNVVMAS